MKKQIKWDLPQGLKMLSSCFLWGGFCGIFFAGFLLEEGQGTLSDYFLQYFNHVEEYGQTQDFFAIFWSNLKIPMYTFLLGFSLLGTIGVPLLFISQGFIFTFSVSSLCRLWGVSGLIPSFFLFCLPAFLWVPVLFFLGLQSLRSAHLLWNRTKTEEIYQTGYFFQSGIGFLGVICSIAFDYMIMPILVQAVSPFAP